MGVANVKGVVARSAPETGSLVTLPQVVLRQTVAATLEKVGANDPQLTGKERLARSLFAHRLAKALAPRIVMDVRARLRARPVRTVRMLRRTPLAPRRSATRASRNARRVARRSCGRSRGDPSREPDVAKPRRAAGCGVTVGERRPFHAGMVRPLEAVADKRRDGEGGGP